MEFKNFKAGNVTVLPPKKICDICGAEIEGNANFCSHCGIPCEDFSDDAFDEIYKPAPKNIPVKKPKKFSKQPQQQIIQQSTQQQIVQQPTPQKIVQPPIQNNFALVNEIKCPRCGSKNFKSCQMIYNSGTRTRSFNSSTGYSSYGTNSSILAQNAAPPFMKKTYWLYSIIFIALAFFSELASKFLPFIIAGILCIILLSSFSHSRSKKGIEFVFIIPAGICWFLIQNNILSPNLISTVAFVIGGVLSIKTLYSYIWNKNRYPKLYSDWLNTFVCSKCGTFFK